MKNASYYFVWNIIGFRITVYFFVTFCYYGSFCFCSIGKEHSLLYSKVKLQSATQGKSNCRKVELNIEMLFLSIYLVFFFLLLSLTFVFSTLEFLSSFSRVLNLVIISSQLIFHHILPLIYIFVKI
jgi:hypothetical protein